MIVLHTHHCCGYAVRWVCVASMILSSTPKSLNLSLVVPAGCALIFAFLFLASLSPSYIHFSSGVHSAGFELSVFRLLPTAS